MRQPLKGALCALALAACWAGPAAAWADAVVERFTRSDGFAGMGAFEQTSVTVTSPSAQREEGQTKFTGSFLAAIQKMAGMGDTVRITRLDRDLVWELDPEKRGYTEQPLTARGERERGGPTPTQPAPQKGEPSDVVVTKNEFKVERTGARKTINGFACEEYLATWVLETRNTKTGETGKSVMTDRVWTTPETADLRAATAVETAYSRAYLKKIGLEMSPAEARKLLVGLTGLSEPEQQKALARAGAEMGKIQGYQVVSQIEWNVEGSGSPAQGPGASRDTGGGRDPGMAEVMGQLGKLFGGAARSGEAPAGGKAGAERRPSLFTLYTEVKSVRSLASDPARFEVPAGYTRK
ncbi:MAG: hypothetical protein ACREMB_15650 [Candidatus Rokuibacteriota bacterium]